MAGWMDGWMKDGGWMTCDFTPFSTLFQSHQDDERLIMNGCVQWDPVYGREGFASSGARTRDRLISRPALNTLSYPGSRFERQ